MKRSILSALVLAALAAPAALVTTAAHADEAASPHTFSGNVTVASEYLYRGIAQTRGKPALQGGLDYAHSSGFYVGTWASTITWIDDAVAGANVPVELDIYGGFKGSLGGDFSYDVGVLNYIYPGSGKTLVGVQELKQDTTEIYGALSWKWLTLKYSYSTTALFGWAKVGTTLTDKTRGSDYIELNGAWDLGDGWGLNAHLGHQKVAGNAYASYSDYKLGATKDVGFGVVGVAVTGTDAKDSCNGNAAADATQAYCYVKHDGSSAYSSGKTRVLVTFGTTF
jgi:uncharacterized protein (TIGR02001 family)